MRFAISRPSSGSLGSSWTMFSLLQQLVKQILKLRIIDMPLRMASSFSWHSLHKIPVVHVFQNNNVILYHVNLYDDIVGQR